MPLDDPSAQSAAVPEATSHSQDVRNVENDDDNETGSKFGDDDNGPNQFVDALELDAVTDATADNKSDVYKVDEYPTDTALWPTAVDSMREYWVKKGSELCQNKNSSFEASKVTDGDRQARYCSKTFFTIVHELTSTEFNRSWLCYSPSTGKVYCFHCKLFSTQKNAFCGDGFNDWKNGSATICAHEKSTAHIAAVQSTRNLSVAAARIDENIVKQFNAECQYFRSVLERVVEVIKFLAERGLALRGHDELLGSAHNGNFLGILELIAKFDPFLSAHLEKHKSMQQQHQRSVSYLSSTICNEIINVMGQQLMDTIVHQIKRAKYYSVSIDSTPDACKVDRLTCIVRYLPEDSCVPVERFLKFLDMSGHTASEISTSLLTFLEKVVSTLQTVVVNHMIMPVTCLELTMVFRQ
jgi:hypothetical protein